MWTDTCWHTYYIFMTKSIWYQSRCYHESFISITIWTCLTTFNCRYAAFNHQQYHSRHILVWLIMTWQDIRMKGNIKNWAFYVLSRKQRKNPQIFISEIHDDNQASLQDLKYNVIICGWGTGRSDATLLFSALSNLVLIIKKGQCIPQEKNR